VLEVVVGDVLAEAGGVGALAGRAVVAAVIAGLRRRGVCVLHA
jgi:hypothetical protein